MVSGNITSFLADFPEDFPEDFPSFRAWPPPPNQRSKISGLPVAEQKRGDTLLWPLGLAFGWGVPLPLPLWHAP